MERFGTTHAPNVGSRHTKQHRHFTTILKRLHAAFIRSAAWFAVVLGALC